MASISIKTVLSAMKEHPLVETHRGASEHEIKYFRKIANRPLPVSYKTFLSEIGFAYLGSDILYGLGPDATRATSVLENMVFESVNAEPPMRSTLIPVMGDGAGNHFCLDTAAIKDGDCPVVFWDHEHSRGMMQRPERVSVRFAVWLQRQLKQLSD
ncbi:MAG: SMI1/KNR4 family protein [Phycisphaeraceae bacterium]|nr:SMI1/KNR4 family protein [Phycisphaeraceae bacterium]